jgi:hypothetical protein
VGVDAPVAALADVANHAVYLDLVDVTLAQFDILSFHILFKRFHVASPEDLSFSARACFL